MKVFIIEDELMALKNLQRALHDNFEDMEVVGHASSVKDSVAWLKEPSNKADIVFMDVELSDGNCFEIFKETDITSPVVMTTAYDSYAVKAFEAGSVDYLLKPIDPKALKRAVDRCRSGEDSGEVGLEKMLRELHGTKDNYKERFLIYFNDRIIPVRSNDIAYFYSESKDNRIVTLDGASYAVDSSLDTISAELDPSRFFRISRKCIVSKDSVDCITKLSGGRLMLEMRIVPKGQAPDFTVSRARVDDFIAWLEN